jgi:hypothetical protein
LGTPAPSPAVCQENLRNPHTNERENYANRRTDAPRE